ncbi:hypothetical protein FBU30_001805 [Linnemannia zychae]|nr:hypothetical protein FBU30_001805 [Linnemannia zychae]
MPDFSRSLEYYVQNDAHVAFTSLLAHSTLPQGTRDGALAMYNTWLRNHSDGFWTSRIATLQIKTSTNREVGEIVEGGDKIRKRMINYYINDEIRSPSPSGSKLDQPNISTVNSDDETDTDFDVQVLEYVVANEMPYLGFLLVLCSLPEVANRLAAQPSPLSELHLAQQERLSAFFLESDALAVPKFGEKNRRSFGERFQALGEKWVLRSGRVVENILYLAGSKAECETYSALHSIMIDLDDPSVEKLFSEEEWTEIIEDLPCQSQYSETADIYMDSFHYVKDVQELERALRERPEDPDALIVHYCLSQWYVMAV